MFQQDGENRGPLTGVKVLDLSTVVSGPMCSQVLGDFGADVVKVEAPRGDTSRYLGVNGPPGYASLFAHVNRNKRGIALDLKQPEAIEVARRLAREADVLLENFRPGVADRLGLGDAALRPDNPRLIYVSVNGFGPEGPYVGHPAYDTVIQGLVGFMPVQGSEDDPRLIRHIAADKSTALTAAYAVMAALYAREKSGVGQHVDVPMLDAYAAFTLPDVLGVETFTPDGSASAPPFDAGAIHRAWPTADGFVVMLIIEDSQFQAICRAIDREDMIDDPRCENLITRIMHAAELFAMFEEEVGKWPTAELIERARRFGAPMAPVNSLAEFLSDPQAQANGTVFETAIDEQNGLRLLRNPVRFSETPASHRKNPPALGEDSESILREAGYSESQIQAMRASGAVV